jgi:hypothetical protein
VLDQLRLLPKELGEALPYAHHRLLLPVRDTEQKVRLAQEVVDHGLPTRKLEEKIKKLRAKSASGEKRGRKPQPTFVKAIIALVKAAEELGNEPPLPEALASHGSKDVRRLLKELREAMERFTALGQALHAQAG